MPATDEEEQKFLLDGNLLIAFHDFGHPHFARASEWIDEHTKDTLVVCAITEGTLLRFLMSERDGIPPIAAEAWRILRDFRARRNVVFLGDNLSYLSVPFKGLTGRKEVTDAWLAAFARSQGLRLVTFDKGFAAKHSDISELLAK
jgi:toxin-antitoxin system PIN domain toxin